MMFHEEWAGSHSETLIERAAYNPTFSEQARPEVSKGHWNEGCYSSENISLRLKCSIYRT